jgi:predicted ATPase
VGRDEELQLLRDLLHATTRDGRARLASIVGIAGIGKSRLAWELEKYVDGLAADIYWHRGRSPAYGEGLAFWALGEMVRERARIAESDDAATSREKLAASLREYVADASERAWMEPRLAALLGLEAAPPGEREEFEAACRTLFDRVSERGTVVLVFEELQWADPALLDFIETITDRSRARPILVVTLSRPDLLERRPTWGAGLRSFSNLPRLPLAPTRWRCCWWASPRACRRRPSPPSSSAPRESRSTRWRWSGCSWTRASSASGKAVTTSTASWARWPSPARWRGSSGRGSTG